MSPRGLDDILVDLLGRIAAGEKAAFNELYRRTSAKLFGIARRILGNDDAALEALQEAYVAIWRQAARFDRKIASATAWLSTIARHKAIDVRRLNSERVSGATVPMNDDIPSALANAEEETARNQALKRLLACLDELPEDRRQMVLLAYYQGWSRAELGHRFDRPVTTIKTILRRSLMLLKECLDGER